MNNLIYPPYWLYSDNNENSFKIGIHIWETTTILRASLSKIDAYRKTLRFAFDFFTKDGMIYAISTMA